MSARIRPLLPLFVALLGSSCTLGAFLFEDARSAGLGVVGLLLSSAVVGAAVFQLLRNRTRMWVAFRLQRMLEARGISAWPLPAPPLRVLLPLSRHLPRLPPFQLEVLVSLCEDADGPRLSRVPVLVAAAKRL